MIVGGSRTVPAAVRQKIIDSIKSTVSTEGRMTVVTEGQAAPQREGQVHSTERDRQRVWKSRLLLKPSCSAC